MPKLQIKATEIENPDIARVAMVKRGANRLPFKIMKEDGETMLDLGKIGRIFKQEPTAPVAVAVVLSKTADLAAITPLLKSAGFDVSSFVKHEDANSVTFTKGDKVDVKDENALIIKASDDVAFVVQAPSEIVKALSTYDWESTSFKEILQKGAFCPSVSMAQSVLQQTFYNIWDSAENASDLSKLMKAAVDDFNAYVVSLAKALPTSVFKADVELVKAMAPKAKGKAAAAAAAEDAKDGGADDASENADGSKKKTPAKKAEEISANPAVGNDTDTSDPTKKATKQNIEGSPVAGSTTSDTTDPTKGAKNGDPEADPVAGSKSSASGKIGKNEGDATAVTDPDAARKLDDKTSGTGAQQAPAGMETVVKGLFEQFATQMGEQISGLKKHVDDQLKVVKEDVTKVSAAVQKADEALSGTVLGDAAGDKTGIVKTDESAGAPPLLDTAFMKLDEDLPLDRKRPVTH